MPLNPQRVSIPWRGRTVHIEYGWIEPVADEVANLAAGLPDAQGTATTVTTGAGPGPGGAGPELPLMVFLHEGLGSLSMWRDFPQRVCRRLGIRGLVYSRPGYGRSTPRDAGERWAPDFMHHQAHELLPALLRALGVDSLRHPPWLLGHSDGGSIALLHAAQRPAQVAGVVVMAPHIRVEAVSLASIERARQAYLHTDLRQRLARHHDDPDSAFWGWNDIWLNPAFAAWNIEAELSTITAPLLAVQGLDDEYGTLEQIRGIARQVPQARLLELPACGHSPHRDQPDVLLDALQCFFDSVLDARAGPGPHCDHHPEPAGGAVPPPPQAPPPPTSTR